MGDSGKWWQGIIDKITGKMGQKMTNDELKGEKQQVISQLKLDAEADEWEEVSRLAKNVKIYDKLIDLQKDITKMEAERMAKDMEELLDEEFQPVMPEQSGHDEFLKKVEALAPGFDGDDDFSEIGAMKPKLKRRKSRKRKSRKRKSRKIKSKKRKRSSKKSRRRR